MKKSNLQKVQITNSDKSVNYYSLDLKLEVNMEDETVWLTQVQMAKLFNSDYKTIRKHIKNALEG